MDAEPSQLSLNFLGKSLSFLYPTICRLNEKYQLDYCGEGGEYESFVVDCPLFLTQRIEITQSQVVHDPEDPSVGNLWITECKLVDKDPPIPISDDVGGQITPEDGVDSSLLSSPVHSTCLPPYVPRRPQKYHPVELTFDCDGYSQSPLLLPSSRVHSPNSLDFSIANTCLLQLEDIFSQLSQMIPSSISSLADAVFVHLYVSDMSLFDTLNKCYCQHFAQTKYPPSRVCVAVSFFNLIGC